VLVIAVAGRLLSGVHWFTDIVGGVLISMTLLACFSGVKGVIQSKKF
jgi:undecaprenyl-diphosphatase